MDKRVRTSWRVRRQYRWARAALTCLGALLGLGVALTSALGLGAMTPGTLVQLALGPLLAAALAWIGVTLLWRRKRNRNLWDWQSLH
jgi:hypothetical protein